MWRIFHEAQTEIKFHEAQTEIRSIGINNHFNTNDTTVVLYKTLYVYCTINMNMMQPVLQPEL